MDRSKRYDNPPKGKRNGSAPPEEGGAKRKAEATAGSPPDMKDAHEVGKTDNPAVTPDGGGDESISNVMVSRHKQEHAGMLKRHGEEHGMMVERHGKEAKEMHTRHGKEMADHFESKAEGEVARDAGHPKELGTPREEGKGGSN